MEKRMNQEPTAIDLKSDLGNFMNISAFDSEYEKKRLKHIGEEEQERINREARELANLKESLWRNSNVPERHRNFTLPDSGAWLEAFKFVSGQMGSGVLFLVLGPRGTGKTQIATALIKEACFEGKKSKYYKAIDIFIALRGSFRKDGDSEIEVIERFLKPDILVIDAMEERGETPFEDRLLNHIIDKRYDNLSDTILITNQTAEKFAESVGPSIVSRIHETGDKIVCDWPSFRTKK